MKKKTSSSNKANKAGMWQPLLWSYGMAFAGIAVSWCGCEIVLASGPWALPLVIAYVAVLIAPVGWFLSAKEKYSYRSMVGEEVFYQTYPEDMTKALRRAKRKGLPAETQRALADCGQIFPLYPEERTQITPKQFLGRVLLAAGAAVCAALSAYLVISAIPGFKNLFPLGEKSDFTPLLSLLAGVFSLLSAIFLLFRKRSIRLMGSTMTMLIANAWACFIAWTVRKTYTRTEFFLLLGSIGLYALAGMLLPILAGDVQSPAQKKAEYRSFVLGLFTLGAIDEEEMNRRLEKQRQTFP